MKLEKKFLITVDDFSLLISDLSPGNDNRAKMSCKNLYPKRNIEQAERDQ